ncbi:MAG: hypothetical protein MUP14_01885 [Dehalococcoidia bacterium]|nr:hypothetical protein [Dehalococcoidia bacterium]
MDMGKSVLTAAEMDRVILRSGVTDDDPATVARVYKLLSWANTTRVWQGLLDLFLRGAVDARWSDERDDWEFYCPTMPYGKDASAAVEEAERLLRALPKADDLPF